MSVRVKSGGLDTADSAIDGALPAAVIVYVAAFPCTIACGGVVTDKEKSCAGIPIPLRAQVCGLLRALSRISSVALRTPGAPGVNVIVTVHVTPLANAAE